MEKIIERIIAIEREASDLVEAARHDREGLEQSCIEEFAAMSRQKREQLESELTKQERAAAQRLEDQKKELQQNAAKEAEAMAERFQKGKEQWAEQIFRQLIS